MWGGLGGCPGPHPRAGSHLPAPSGSLVMQGVWLSLRPAGGGGGPGRGRSPRGTPPALLASHPTAPGEERGPLAPSPGEGRAGDGFPSAEELEKQVVRGWVGRGGAGAEHRAFIAPIWSGAEHSSHPVWGWGLSAAHSLHPSGTVPGPRCQALRLRPWVPACLSPPPAPAAAAPGLPRHAPAQPAPPAPPAHSLCPGVPPWG